MRIPLAGLPLSKHRTRLATVAAGLALLLAACSVGPSSETEINGGGDKPYTVSGIRYFPKADPNYDAVGLASWYGPGFHGRPTASGRTYDMNAMTAAHQTLPFGTKVRVTNLENGRSASLTVNDRGPFVQDRIIDVSRKAATRLGFHKDGVARVRVRVLHEHGEAMHGDAANTARGRQDADYFMPILAQAMESKQRLKRFAWRNSENGRNGHIMPLTEPSSSQAMVCRNYRRTTEEGTRRTVYVGRACRAADGSWRVAREDRENS